MRGCHNWLTQAHNRTAKQPRRARPEGLVQQGFEHCLTPRIRFTLLMFLRAFNKVLDLSRRGSCEEPGGINKKGLTSETGTTDCLGACG